jgi:hypothetical protein
MIDEATKVLMLNWATWRIQRERPGISMSNAYSLAGRSSSNGGGTIVLMNDEAFEVEQACSAMVDYLRQAAVEYWLRSDPVPRKASRCHCSVRTYWRRLDRAHELVHAFRRALQVRQQAARAAFRKGELSFAF